MQREFKQGSEKLVQGVLDEVDVYHFTNYPWQASLQDIKYYSFEKLRRSFLVGKYGLLADLPTYRTPLGRVFEYTLYGDYLQSLRQKLNIINEMAACDFKSNLPVHISVSPKGEKKEIDLYNLNSHENFSFIVHPGQTRCQASVFTKTPLRNVLFYVNKKHREQCQFTLIEGCSKIETPNELLSIFNPSEKTDNKLFYDFYIPGQVTGVKRKEHLGIPILKLNQIKDENSNKSYHCSKFYLETSFTSMRNFSEIFWKMPFNIYSTNLNETESIQNENRNKLLQDGSICLDEFQYDENKPHENGESLIAGLTKPNNPIFNVPEDELNDFKGLAEFMETYNKKRSTDWGAYEEKQPLQNLHTFMKPVYIPIEEKTTSKKIVKLNEYKGFCIYIDSNNIKTFKRDLYELLFYINSDVAMSCNKNKTVVIFNCEHEFWKTGKNYSSWNIEDTFYN